MLRPGFVAQYGVAQVVVWPNWRVRHRVASCASPAGFFLLGGITARILDGARGVAQMIAWPKIVVLQHAAMSVTRSMQHRRRSLTTRIRHTVTHSRCVF